MQHFMVVVALTACILTQARWSGEPQARPKVAVVDVGKVLRGYRRSKNYLDGYDASIAKWKREAAEYAKLLKDGNHVRWRITEAEDMKKAIRDREEAIAAAKNLQFTDEWKKRCDSVLQEIVDHARRCGAARGYAVLLVWNGGATGSEAKLFGGIAQQLPLVCSYKHFPRHERPSADLTDDVIEGLNRDDAKRSAAQWPIGMGTGR